MAYIDYRFYREEYGGKVIPSADFIKLATYASYKVDEITFNRAKDYLERFETEIKLAACAVAEALYKTADKENIASEHVGNYSVTYRAEGGTVKRAVSDAARPYLINTGLMSRRIG